MDKNELIRKLNEAIAPSNEVLMCMGKIQENMNVICRLQPGKYRYIATIVVAILSLFYLLPVTLMYPLIGCIMTVIILGGTFLIDSSVKKSIRKKREKQIAELDAENNDINNRILQLFNQNAEYVEIISQTYFYPLAIQYFIEVLQAGRADNLKEAKNLFEEQMHRWKMEDMAKANMIANQRAAIDAAAIRRTSAANAGINAVGAAANVARLFR